MKTVVCVKSVPSQVTKVAVAEGHDRVSYEAGPFLINESDECALEEAVVLKNQYGGEVTVITVGPLKTQQALYVGLAKGADKAIRIDADFANAESISEALAAALRNMEYDLILTGVESSDAMAAQVGVSLAERLGMPFAYAVTKVEKGGEEGTLKITKEMGGGVEQVLEMSLPALMCIQVGIVPVSYTSLRKLLQARSKPVRCLTLTELNIEDVDKREKRAVLVNISLAKRTRRAEIIVGATPKVASAVVQKIREAL